MAVIRINDLTDERIAAYTRLTELELRCRLEPEKGIFIAESAKVMPCVQSPKSVRTPSGESSTNTTPLYATLYIGRPPSSETVTRNFLSGDENSTVAALTPKQAQAMPAHNNNPFIIPFTCFFTAQK